MGTDVAGGTSASALEALVVDDRSGTQAQLSKWGRHGWIVRRVGLGVLTLLAVSIVIFVAMHLLPGDAAQAILGSQATPERLAQVRQQLGLDRSLVAQYWDWISGLPRGDLGMSFASQSPVSDLVGQRVGNTLLLLLLAGLVAIPISYAIGILSAIRPNGVIDSVSNVTSITLAGLPEFVIGIVLVLVFSTSVVQIFPATAIVPDGGSPLQRLDSLVLPVVTLTLAVVPYLSRLVRASLVDALSSEYVVMARLKGLPPRVILLRHALRNGLVPTIQGTALTLSYLLGGVVVVEVIFQYPGLGSALASAVNQRDVPAIQAIVLIFAAGYVLFNLVADVLTVYVTPRLRTSR